MKTVTGSPRVVVLFILLLCGLILISALTAPILGYKLYTELSSRGDADRNERNCISYILDAFRRTDNQSAVKVRNFRGISALELTGTSRGSEKIKLIYLWDGSICELSIDPYNLTASPEQGTALLPAKYLEFTMLGSGLVQVECNAGSGLVTMTLSARTEGSAAA